jgi:hypothetical protein
MQTYAVWRGRGSNPVRESGAEPLKKLKA